MQDPPLRLQIEPFHVQGAAVTGGHQNRDAPCPRRLADQNLGVERVALLDQDVDIIEECFDGVRGDASVENLHRQVGIELGNAPCGQLRLVESQVEHRGGHAVEVGQFQLVEVREAQLTAQSLLGHDVGDGVADAEADDAHSELSKPRLFFDGDQIPVAVEPHGAKSAWSEHACDGPPPGKVGPALGFGDDVGVGRRAKPA